MQRFFLDGNWITAERMREIHASKTSVPNVEKETQTSTNAEAVLPDTFDPTPTIEAVKEEKKIRTAKKTKTATPKATKSK